MAKHLQNELLSHAEAISNIGIWEFDIESNDFYWSDGVFIICGYEPQEFEVTFEKNLSVIHPDDREFTIAQVQNAIATRKGFDVRKRFITKQGAVKHINSKGNLIKDNNGNAIKLRGVFQDITHIVDLENTLKKNNDELLRTNDILKNAQKITKMGHWEYNLATDELFWSDELYQIFEIDKEDNKILNFNDFGQFIHPDDIIKVIEAKNLTVSTGKLLSVQHQIITKNKQEKIVRVLAEKVFNKETDSFWLYGTIRESTDAVLNQIKIEESEKKYKYLFESNPSAMFLYDFKTLQMTDCNNEALELYGYTRNEFLQLSVRDIRPKEDIELLNKITASEETYGQINKNIWRHKKKNGEIIFVDATGHLIDFKSKRSSLVQVSDITEKLKTDEAIKASEQQRELIMNAALDAIICINIKGDITFWNPQAERIFGWKDEEVMGKNLGKLIFPSVYRDAHEAGIKHYLKTKEGPVFNKLLEIAALNKAGKEFSVELTVVPIQLGDEEFFCSFIRDISKRKTAEIALKESENRHKILFQNSPIPKWVYDLEEFRFQDVNQTAIAHYGYSREEFLSMTLSDIRPKEDITKLLEIQKTVNDREGVLYFGIFNHLKKDKTIIKVEVAGQKISYLGKDCMMVVCNDVTEREMALELIKDKEAKLLKAQKIAKLGYCHFDIQNKKTIWSAEIFNIWEINPDDGEPDAETFIQTIHPDDRLDFILQQNEAIYNTSVLDMVHRIILPGNKIKWIHCKGELIKDQYENPLYLEGTMQDITEEKNLGISIFESNQRFEYVTKATFDAIWDWDLTTDLIYWGQGIKSIFGYEPLEIEPDISSWTNRIHPEDYQKVTKSIHSCINDTDIDDNWIEEFRYLKADGNYAFVQDKGIVIRDKTGVATRMVGAMQDITKRKEEVLRLQLLETVITNTNDAVLITEAEPFDEPGPKILYVNEGFTKMTGYLPEEVIGKTPRILQGPKSDKEELKRLSKALRNWESCEITTINYKKNGEEFYINFSVNPVADKTGFFTHWIAIERDVTESVIAQQKLMASFDEKDTILESIDDGFFATDKNSIVTYWNKKAEILLNAKKEDVLGKNLHEMFPDPNSLAFHHHYQLAIKENKTVHFEEYSVLNKKWFEVSAFASDKGLSVYFKDVTDKKQVESKLLELNQILLKQTNDLSISNKELEQFAYVASHDLQEPLRMVTSFLSQIEKKYGEILDEKGKQYIYYAVDGAKRMRQIILDLLEFSRIGRLSENLEEVDLNAIVQEIQTLYRKPIDEVSASIEFGDFPKILSYKTPIRQVLQNLISNALKYHSKNIPTIIKIEVKEEDKFWQFAVKDNGIGINEEYHQKIFIIFQRLHNKDEYSGTGMGLAICKKIVENLGGKIWVEAEEGKGSTFYFTILKN